MNHPDSVPAPVPDRVLLPAPDGERPAHVWQVPGRAWWRLSTGSVLHAEPGHVICTDFAFTDPDSYERDALSILAAVRWARGES